MPRSSTTALYTRVDNSFSNPVVGTTIDPTHADSFFDDVESAVNAFIATSASSVAIGTGSKTFTVAADVAGKAFLAGTFVHIFSRADTADYMFGSVTSYSTSTGALVVDVVATGGSGTNTDWNIIQAGARGAVGATGTTGPTGATSGIKQTYDNSTTDADPGNGDFRLNHATPASATAAYLDNLDSAGATVSGIIDLWDDSTNTTKGYLRIEKSTDPTVWAQFAVTGSVVDGTGYRKLTLGSGSGSGAFTNGDTFAITFYRSGDKGADGAGAGDVTAASNFSNDNRIIRSDAPSAGKGVQQSGVTIDDSDHVSGLASLTLTNTGLHLLDTNASHDLIIAPGSDLSADRTLTVTTGDADRTLTLSANLTVSGAATLTGSPVEQGKHTIWIPASAMLSATTSGPASAQFESSTNDRNFKVLDFDASADEHAHFNIAFPKGWNESTVTFQAFWMSTATDTDGVAWALEGAAVSDNESTDGSWGTAVVVTDDAQSAAGEVYVTSESAAVTIGGTPAEGDICYFRIFRDVSDANDDMTEDARLIGIKLFYTINAATDA